MTTFIRKKNEEAKRPPVQKSALGCPVFASGPQSAGSLLLKIRDDPRPSRRLRLGQRAHI